MKKMKALIRRFAGVAVLGMSTVVLAEDIDIFMANSGGSALGQPNIMLLVDNSSNWSREAQKWPDNGGAQGVAEVQAIRNVVASLTAANIGYAGLTGSGSSIGGYIRFGIRNMSDSANKAALLGILDHIKSNINAPAEKVNDNAEAAALYEVYKYFRGDTVFRGALVSSNTPATNADVSGNNGQPASAKPTAYSRGLSSGFALSGSTYQLPAAGAACGRNYLIMLINNAQGSLPTGSRIFESGGADAGEALAPIPGVSETSWTDEWARFLYDAGISVYILDAYNAQQNVSHSRVLQRAALVGGGKYFAVKNQQQIELAIKQILAEINALNATFATASLPISATNRSQNLNQVFIGMFRPDGQAEPRWMGNLKQYQLLKTDTGIELGDSRTPPVNAINLNTGFVSECAVSFWTSDSGSYWQDVYENALTRSNCTVFPTVGGLTGSEWSDLPDGPAVEKGGVAEVLRKGNNPPATNTTPTWGVGSRTLLTYSSTAASRLQPLESASTGWSSTLLDWVKGLDDATVVTVDNVDKRPYSEFTNVVDTARTRPSIHGDVIHSRPLPVNYGNGGVTVYYGSNDGFLRAVDAATGKERWAFAAPEHFARFQRLHDNAPLMNYPNVAAELNPRPKDYFFDGSIGIYQNVDNTKVWIFPSQRRGGRMLYGFDVTNPASPVLKWRVGCPNMTDDTGCTTGFENMGQTWSMPMVAFLRGFSTTTPVIIVGAGYDTCEDADTASPSCSGRRGTGVYVINADTGARLAYLPTSGSVPSDLALADSNNDGSVDFAYVATTTGEIYRIDFSSASYVPAAAGDWAIRKVAHTAGAGRKFLYPPALLQVNTQMYVALGSGDREHPLNSHYPLTTPVLNRFYVYLDDLTVAASASAASINLDSDSRMQDYSSSSTQICGVSGVTPGSGLKGWFMDLTGDPDSGPALPGEQTVTSALIAAGMVAFNTNRALTGSTNTCVNPLGEARGYWVNLINASGAIGTGSATCGGDRSSVFVGGGLMPSPTMATVEIDGKTETVAIGASQRSGGASSGIAPQAVKPAIKSKRRAVYWKSNTAD